MYDLHLNNSDRRNGREKGWEGREKGINLIQNETNEKKCTFVFVKIINCQLIHLRSRSEIISIRVEEGWGSQIQCQLFQFTSPLANLFWKPNTLPN